MPQTRMGFGRPARCREATAIAAPMSHADAAVLAERLLAWYRLHARVLPWRSEPTPYAVLLSELMCQQTRIDTVLPYFARFLARWPTLEDLAAADVDEVVREWAGLGYYSRARNLHRAAQAAVEAGGLPDRVDALRALPGIGPYTAGAIASIAFGIAAPAVDGNVERVLSRVDGRTADPRSPAGRRALEDRALQLLGGPGAPGDVNQALMELGATVCTPRKPACERCPWGDPCASRHDPEALPMKRPKPPPRPMRGVAGLLVDEGRFLLGRRPPGLLGGLWEPIGCEVAGEPSRHDLERAFSDRVGLRVRAEQRLGEIVHVFTHRRLVLDVWAVEGAGAPSALAYYDDVAWVDAASPHVALSTLARRTIALSAAREAAG